MPERIVITGYGSCSAAGNSEGLWEKSLRKEQCFSAYRNDDVIDCPVELVGRVPLSLGGIFPPQVAPFISRHALLGAASLRESLETAGIGEDYDDRGGLVFCSASQGIDRIEEVMRQIHAKPFQDIDYNIINSASNAGACHLLASHFKIHGHVYSVESASSSGMLSLFTAWNGIRSGLCDRMHSVVGEANLYAATFLFYSRKKRLGDENYSFFGRVDNPEKRKPDEYVVPFCPPLVSDRGVIAEGGGALLLESLGAARSRGAKIFAEIEDAGFFFHSDNYGGRDYELVALRKILDKYRDYSFDSIYIPITGCYILDVSLYGACSRYFPGTHVFTMEPIIGHTGAATSLLNIVLAIMSLDRKILLPTKNVRPGNYDEYFKLAPGEDPIQKKDIQRILVVSAGWGGYNGACVVKKFAE